MQIKYVTKILFLILVAVLASSKTAWAVGSAESMVAPVLLYASIFMALCVILYFVSRNRQEVQNPENLHLRGADNFSDIDELVQLRQENEKLKSELKKASIIINMAPYPIWQRNDEQKIQFYNLAYGEAIEDVADNTDMTITPELDKKIPVYAKQAMESNMPVFARRHVVIEGERKLYQIAEMPVPEEKVSVGFATDVSETEKLQEDLQRHISAQDDLLESSANAMAIYGPDMRLKNFNSPYVSLWRLDELWLESQPTYGEILEKLRENRHLPEQANFQLFKQQRLKLFTTLIDPQEEFFYLPDGKTLRVIAIPHALGGILFSYEDVTDRLALERSYNTLTAVQSETLDNLHEGVAVYGEDGHLKIYNPGYLTLWDIDKEWARSLPHVSEIAERCKNKYIYDDWETFKREHIGLLQTRKPISQLLELTDGTVINWRKVPLPDGATLISYLDVTDSTLVERSLRELNEALQEADHLKSEFLANVSYELRSPLTSISGFSEMLSQEYFGSLGDKQKEYVEGIHNSSQHLMQLINDILDLASIEAGYMRLNVVRFDIHDVMKAVSSLVRERAKERNQNVVFECPEDIGTMVGDETRIKQILFNLLSNAFKHSNDGDSITLGAMGREEAITIWVEDEGHGIAEEDQKTVFDNFHQGKSGKEGTGQRSGTGLGLSIVKNFIELHGGTVELSSELGKGTRFECHLPRESKDLLEILSEKAS